MSIPNSPLISGILLVAILAIVAPLIRLLLRSHQRRHQDEAYEATASLLTPAERSFFGVLQQAVMQDHLILAKVRLADIVRPVRGSNRGGWQSAFNRISMKHVDFVLCDPSSLKVVAVIELDDRSHAKFERGLRDRFVDSALAGASIPVLRIPARNSYSPEQIRERISLLLGSQTLRPFQHDRAMAQG